MCESQPWCHTKGALQATLGCFPGVEVKFLCHANVREPAMVSYQGGSASNIEALSLPGTEFVPSELVLNTELVSSKLYGAIEYSSPILKCLKTTLKQTER